MPARSGRAILGPRNSEQAGPRFRQDHVDAPPGSQLPAVSASLFSGRADSALTRSASCPPGRGSS